MFEHPFWFALTMIVIVWYSTITVYVAIRGLFDIRHMLESLREQQNEQATTDES